MEEFELLRNVTIGQYIPTGSVIHRLDPRVKLLAFVLIIGAITFETSYLGNLALLLVIGALVLVARIPLGYALSGLKPALPVLVLLAVLQIIFYTEGFATGSDCRELFRVWWIKGTTCSIQLAVVSTARFLELLMLTSLLTFSTSTTELAHGTEMLLTPFRRFRVPAHEVALILTIALRFVPTFAEELERIMKAQVSRGADLGQRGRLRFVQQTKALLPLIVPLFLSAFRRAEDLVLAMESRCYTGGAGRTHFTELHATRRDRLILLATLALVVATIFAPWPF